MFRVIVLIFISSFCGLYAEISSEANNILKEIDNKNNEYHSGERLVRTSEAKDILSRIKNSNLSEEEKMYLSIECYTLWANVSIASGTFEEDYKILGDIYKNLKKDNIFTELMLILLTLSHRLLFSIKNILTA